MEQSTTSFELYREGLDIAVALHNLHLELKSEGFKMAISSLDDFGIVVVATITTKGVPGWIKLPDVLMDFVSITNTPSANRSNQFRPVASPIEQDTYGFAFGLTLPLVKGQSARDLLSMTGKLVDLGKSRSKPTTSEDSLITWNPGALKGNSEEQQQVTPFEGKLISQSAQFDSPRYVVWNADKSIGFITTEWQLAYESRKGADSNCYSEKLNSLCGTAVGFCDDTGDENCTMEELVSFTTQPAKKPTE